MAPLTPPPNVTAPHGPDCCEVAAPANDCTGALGCGHVHVADSPGRCWEAPCDPTCPCASAEMRAEVAYLREAGQRMATERDAAVAERDQLRAEVHVLERPHKCVASGMTVARCRDTDLCDCFGGQTPMQRVMDAERHALAARERAEAAEAHLRAVVAVCADVQADDRRSLDTFGQHEHGAVVVVAERVLAAACVAQAPTMEMRQTRWVCDVCGQPSGTFHKGCPGLFRQSIRTVYATPWEPVPAAEDTDPAGAPRGESGA